MCSFSSTPLGWALSLGATAALVVVLVLDVVGGASASQAP